MISRIVRLAVSGVLALSSVMVTAADTGKALNVKLTSAHVEFLAIGNPGFMRIKGVADALESVLTLRDGKLSASLSSQLDAFNSGIDMRDEHMKAKYLETGKYPKAEFMLDPLVIDQAKPAVKDAPFSGKLKLHGVEKPLQGVFTVEKKGEKDVHAMATFELKLKDFNIEIPSFAGVTVAEKVDVQVELDVTLEGQP